MKKILILYILIGFLNISCETEKERSERQHIEKVQRLEIENLKIKKAKEKAFKLEQERLEQEKKLEEERIQHAIRLEKERKEKALYNKYINNSLRTVATPYAYCFGKNEHFGKDSPQTLTNNILEYELILQQNGNFSRKASNVNEAF